MNHILMSLEHPFHFSLSLKSTTKSAFHFLPTNDRKLLKKKFLLWKLSLQLFLAFPWLLGEILKDD